MKENPEAWLAATLVELADTVPSVAAATQGPSPVAD